MLPASRQTVAIGPGPLAYFARHATAADLVLIVLSLAGLWAATQLRAQFFPDVVLDGVTVTVRWDGAAAQDMDGAVVALLEPALRVLEGVTHTAS